MNRKTKEWKLLHTNIYLDMIADIEEVAEALGVSNSHVIRMALREGLESLAQDNKIIANALEAARNE